MSKNKKPPFSITFIILLIIISSVITINVYLDKVVLKHILPSVETYLHKKIEISGISLGFYGIKMYGVKIKDENNTEIFTCNKIYIYFSLKPLINKEFIIEQIRMIKPQTTVYHQPDGKWISPIYTENDKIDQKGKIKIELKKIFIENGEIRIIDDRAAPKAAERVVTDLNNVKGYFDLGEKISYEISASIKNTKGELKILGSVENETNSYKIHFNGKQLDALKFNPYYKQYFNYPVLNGIVTEISLNLTGNNDSYRNKGDIKFQNFDFIYFEGQKPVHAVNGRVAFTSSPNIVVLEDISGVINECSSIKASGKIWPAVENRDRYELLIDLDNLNYLMGKERYILKGGLKKDLNITGNGRLAFRLYVDGDNFKYVGEANLEKAELDWGKVLYKPKNKMCGLIFDINYEKNVKIWGDFKVKSNSLVVDGKGEINNLLDNEPKMDLNITLRQGRVEDLIAFLPPWPKEIRLFGVTNKLNVRIFNNELSKTIYSVSINGTPLMWQYAKLFNKPYGMESKINFDLVPEKDKILISEPVLTFGESEVRTKVIEIYPQNSDGLSMELDFKKLVFDDVRKISNLFKEESFEPDGYCSTKFNLNSTSDKLNLKGIADVQGSKLKYGNFITKNTGIPGNLLFDITWKGNTFIIDNLQLNSLKSKYTLSGEIVDYDKEQPQYDLMVISDSFYWGELTPNYIQGFEDYKLSGMSGVKINITGQKKFLNLKGVLNLDKSETRWKELLRKPKNVDHEINFDFSFGQNNFIINNIDVSLNNFEINGAGKLENFNSENKKLILTWGVNDFNGSSLTGYLPSFGWLKDIKIKGLLKGETNLYKEKNLQKIKGKINLYNIDISYKGHTYRTNASTDNFVWLTTEGEDIIYIDSGQYTIDQSVFKVKGNIKKQNDNLHINLDANCDKLLIKGIISYFSPKMAGELEDLNVAGAGKINLKIENYGKIFNFQGDIDLKDNYFSYKNIIAKPEGLDSKVVFNIVKKEDSVDFDTLSFVWNNSRLDLSGKIDKITTEPILDLSLAGEIYYPEVKMILADTPEGQNIIKKFYSLRDKNEKVSLNLKITGKIENPEIKGDWGLITAVVIKIGLQNSMEFLENAAGKTLETTLNFGKKTIETTVLMGGKVLRETVRAGISVIEGVFKIIWPFGKK
ncbi:MAG: DUF748 domain-containing protein [bacterium]|nr:DUF748 domain-containing protein [bacterium]